MRTTLTIDPEVLNAAKQLAAAGSKSVGQVISELARRGLEANSKAVVRRGFPVFQVSKGIAPLTTKEVHRDEDEV